MTASTISRRTVQVFGNLPPQDFTVKTGETIYQGCLVAKDSNGELVNATEASGFGPFFVATGDVADDNPATGSRFGTVSPGVLSSAAAGTRIKAVSGMFWFANGESIDDTKLGAVAYCDDNQTVKTTSTSTSPVGVIREVDSSKGVLVDLYPHDSVVPNDSINAAKIAAGAVDSSEIANGAVDPVHMATTRYRSVASDGALAIVNTDEMVNLAGSAAGSKAATLTSAVTGQRLKLYLAVRSGGDYSIACHNPPGTAGNVTLDAAGEAPEFAYNGTAWVVMDLGGATFA